MYRLDGAIQRLGPKSTPPCVKMHGSGTCLLASRVMQYFYSLSLSLSLWACTHDCGLCLPVTPPRNNCQPPAPPPTFKSWCRKWLALSRQKRLRHFWIIGIFTKISPMSFSFFTLSSFVYVPLPDLEPGSAERHCRCHCAVSTPRASCFTSPGPGQIGNTCPPNRVAHLFYR